MRDGITTLNSSSLQKRKMRIQWVSEASFKKRLVLVGALRYEIIILFQSVTADGINEFDEIHVRVLMTEYLHVSTCPF